MKVWEFDVGVTTHELLQAHVVVQQYVNVKVAAPDAWSGSLLACQMAGCVGYVTECWVVHRLTKLVK